MRPEGIARQLHKALFRRAQRFDERSHVRCLSAPEASLARSSETTRAIKAYVRFGSKADMCTALGDASLMVSIDALGRLQSSGVVSMRQAADCNPGNEVGQFIDKRLVDRYPEWILCKQIAVSHENVALPHQAYGRAESCPLLGVWRQIAAQDRPRPKGMKLYWSL